MVSIEVHLGVSVHGLVVMAGLVVRLGHVSDVVTVNVRVLNDGLGGGVVALVGGVGNWSSFVVASQVVVNWSSDGLMNDTTMAISVWGVMISGGGVICSGGGVIRSGVISSSVAGVRTSITNVAGVKRDGVGGSRVLIDF